MEADNSSDQRPVIHSSEILAKIELGEDVEYDGVIVEGDLDISGLELPTKHVERTELDETLELPDELKVISSSIAINDSEIKGKVNFGNVHFKESINFEGTEFSGIADFMGAEFAGEHTYFGNAKFNGTYANFRGAEFIGGYVEFVGTEFGGHAEFSGAKFGVNADFWGAKFGRYADFGVVKFDGEYNNFVGVKFTGGYAEFMGVEFSGYTDFRGVEFSGYADFRGVEFGGHADFSGVEFGGYAEFRGAEFRGAKFAGNSNFRDAKFTGNAEFSDAEFVGDVDFWGAEFCENAYFVDAKFTGSYAYFCHDQFSKDVSFENTKFGTPQSQEVACRIAKRKMEEQGNKKAADDYFFREMEAIRVQNGIWGVEYKTYPTPNNIRERLSQFRSEMAQVPSKLKRLLIYDILEYVFIQRIFGYGVRPFNVAKAWLIVVFTLGFVYWIGSGVEKANNTLDWYEYFYFSIVTAATPGYAGYTPASGLYTLIAGAQAIFGTFMWAAFIATFARKWQR